MLLSWKVQNFRGFPAFEKIKVQNKKNQNLWEALIEFHKYLHFHVSDLNNKIE